MSIDLLHATSASNSAFRVVCGELVIKDQQLSHNEALLGVVRSGSAVLESIDSACNLQQNDIYFAAPNQKYSLSNQSNLSIEVLTINFSNPTAVTQDYVPQSIIRAMVNGNCTPFARISPNDSCYKNVLDCIQTVKTAETDKFAYFQLLVYGKLYEVFYELFSKKILKIINAESKSKKYRALLRVTHYIDDHYGEGLSLDEVAAATGISRYYVSHLFKELMNTTFVGYVNELRLNRAAMLLVTSDNPIIDIAAMSGFNNLSNFNRAFKIHFGKTPSAYRKA